MKFKDKSKERNNFLDCDFRWLYSYLFMLFRFIIINFTIMINAVSERIRNIIKIQEQPQTLNLGKSR